MYGSLHFWSLVCLELTLSLKVFCDAEQYCVLLACVDCLQCVSSSAFKGCCSLSSLLRTSQWPEQSVFVFCAFASDVFVSRALVDCLWSSSSQVLHCNFLMCVYIYICIYHIYTSTSISLSISVSIYVYIYIYIYICIYLSIHIYISLSLSIYIYISVYLYINICIYLSLSFSLSIYLSNLT